MRMNRFKNEELMILKNPDRYSYVLNRILRSPKGICVSDLTRRLFIFDDDEDVTKTSEYQEVLITLERLKRWGLVSSQKSKSRGNRTLYSAERQEVISFFESLRRNCFITLMHFKKSCFQGFLK